MSTNELNGYDLSVFDDEEKAEALIKWLDLHEESDVISTSGNYFSINYPPSDDKQESFEYLVLTDEEADRYCEDYLDDSREIWVEAVSSNRTDDSWEEWKESVLKNDGRGSIISGYDGCENEEDVNGTTYYIYRTN
jgi:hypothetical protein